MAPRERRRADGFTMLELLLVLAVLVVVAALAVPRLAGSLAALRVSRGTEQVFAASREGHARAVLRGLRLRLVVDPPTNAFWLEEERKPLTEPGLWSEMTGREDRPYTLAEGVRFGAIRINDEPVADGRVEVRFWADGSSDEAVLPLENEDGDRGAVEIRGLTGRARIVPPEEMDEVLQGGAGRPGAQTTTRTK